MSGGWFPVVIASSWVAVTPYQLADNKPNPVFSSAPLSAVTPKYQPKPEPLPSSCGLSSGAEFAFSLSCAASSRRVASSNPL